MTNYFRIVHIIFSKFPKDVYYNRAYQPQSKENSKSSQEKHSPKDSWRSRGATNLQTIEKSPSSQYRGYQSQGKVPGRDQVTSTGDSFPRRGPPGRLDIGHDTASIPRRYSSADDTAKAEIPATSNSVTVPIKRDEDDTMTASNDNVSMQNKEQSTKLLNADTTKQELGKGVRKIDIRAAFAFAAESNAHDNSLRSQTTMTDNNNNSNNSNNQNNSNSSSSVGGANYRSDLIDTNSISRNSTSANSSRRPVTRSMQGPHVSSSADHNRLSSKSYQSQNDRRNPIAKGGDIWDTPSSILDTTQRTKKESEEYFNFMREREDYLTKRRLERAEPISVKDKVAGNDFDQDILGGHGLDFDQDFVEMPGLKLDQDILGGHGLHMGQDIFGSHGLKLDQDILGGHGLHMGQDIFGSHGLKLDQDILGGHGLELDQDILGGRGLKLDQDILGGHSLDFSEGILGSVHDLGEQNPFIMSSDSDRRHQDSQHSGIGLGTDMGIGRDSNGSPSYFENSFLGSSSILRGLANFNVPQLPGDASLSMDTYGQDSHRHSDSLQSQRPSLSLYSNATGSYPEQYFGSSSFYEANSLRNDSLYEKFVGEPASATHLFETLWSGGSARINDNEFMNSVNSAQHLPHQSNIPSHAQLSLFTADGMAEGVSPSYMNPPSTTKHEISKKVL